MKNIEIAQKHIDFLNHCIDLEEKEQQSRFKLEDYESLKKLKKEGVAIHPIRVHAKSYGFADYPEITFKVPFPIEQNNFKNGSSIEVFCAGEEPIKGVLLYFEDKKGEFRMFCPDFPDWIEDAQVGIKLVPDNRTFSLMRKSLHTIKEHPPTQSLFYLACNIDNHLVQKPFDIDYTGFQGFKNEGLNSSQQNAILNILSDTSISIIHGPPGTGKTTTLVELILQYIQKGLKILVSAPSNTAVDNIAKKLIKTKSNFLRIGNNVKVDLEIFPYTIEGKLANDKTIKEIKRLKIKAEELRKIARQYKRNFGPEERKQRKLLLEEVKNIRNMISDMRKYMEQKYIEQSNIILGTPIGLKDEILEELSFDVLIIDEAGQCLEPLAWCVFPMATKIILVGDHFQLPPTVLSNQAIQLGFNHSILERFYQKIPHIYLLDTQYRMNADIVSFSNDYFYENRIITPGYLNSDSHSIEFYDTAGTGFDEEFSEDSNSFINPGEITIVEKIIEQSGFNKDDIALISPYQGQITYAKENLNYKIRCSTIDSFQGQEMPVIILSLVRSNDKNQIGFLKDYRRMNVALTRAQKKLFVIADSTTLGNDPFFSKFLKFLEEGNFYHSAWELMS